MVIVVDGLAELLCMTCQALDCKLTMEPIANVVSAEVVKARTSPAPQAGGGRASATQNLALPGATVKFPGPRPSRQPSIPRRMGREHRLQPMDCGARSLLVPFGDQHAKAQEWLATLRHYWRP